MDEVLKLSLEKPLPQVETSEGKIEEFHSNLALDLPEGSVTH
jgi:hypothetical protein